MLGYPHAESNKTLDKSAVDVILNCVNQRKLLQGTGALHVHRRKKEPGTALRFVVCVNRAGSTVVIAFLNLESYALCVTSRSRIRK
jgi:hypothetical protein